MKRLLVLTALSLGFLAQADNSYFSWIFVQDSENPVEFSMAKIHVSSSSDADFGYYLSMDDFDDGPDGSMVIPSDLDLDDPDATTGTTIEKTFARLGSFADPDYNFTLELYVWEGEDFLLTHMSDGVNYQDLYTAGYVYENMSTSFASYNFKVHAVPEPTGGMLLLVGGALLMLRRRISAKERV